MKAKQTYSNEIKWIFGLDFNYIYNKAYNLIIWSKLWIL